MDKPFKMTRIGALAGLALPLLAQANGDNDQAATVLPSVQVSAQKLDATSYTADKARTATPLDMPLRDTPQSVSVVTRQRIEDLGLTTVTDVVNNFIGISVNQYETNRAGFTARGFDITNLIVDGIPATWEQALSSGEVASSLAMYERVEVVRGATGLTSGAGNPSAAITLVHKRATDKQLAGSAEIGIGSWNERRALIDVSTPMNQEGTVRGRVVAEYSKRDSWIDLAATKNQTVFATVEADLTPKTLLVAGVSRQETDPKAPMWGGLPFWYTDGSKTNWNPSKTTAASWANWETSYNQGYVNLEHAFDNGWKARVYAARGDRKADSHLLYLSGVPDRATGPGMYSFAGSYVTRTGQDDVNLQLSGPFELLGRKHEAAIGYMHSRKDFNSGSRAADFGTASSDVGNFNTWNGAAFPTPGWGAATFYEESVTRQEALYGMARFWITDPLKVIVGARVSKILDPIEGKAKEVGIKGEFLDGRVNASLAVFDIKQDNLGQVGGKVDRDGDAGPLLPEAYYVGTRGATSRGFEFELNGEVARGWSAPLSLKYKL
jgi:outer membrane receptor for ferric coprogen and ferric-rhodotorulic acid